MMFHVWIALVSLCFGGYEEANDALAERVRQFAPIIEDLTQRKFDELPKIKIVTSVRTDGNMGLLAFYVPKRNEIIVNRQMIINKPEIMAVDRDLAEKALSCLVVHEVVHALQWQVTQREEWPEEIPTILREGHAELIARYACYAAFPDDDAVKVYDAWGSTDNLSVRSRHNTIAKNYGYGRIWLQQVYNTEGTEAVWQRLQQSDISEDTILSDVESIFGKGWTNKGLVMEPFREFFQRGYRNVGRKPRSPVELMVFLDFQLTGGDTEPGDSLYWQVSESLGAVNLKVFRYDASIELNVYRMRNEAQARRFLELRSISGRHQVKKSLTNRLIDGGNDTWYMSYRVNKHPFKLKKGLGFDSTTAKFSLGNQGVFTEFWVQSGTDVFVLFSRGVRLPNWRVSKLMEVLIPHVRSIELDQGA